MPGPTLSATGLAIQSFSEAFAELAQSVRDALGQQVAADSPVSAIGILDGTVARLAALCQEGLQGVYLARTLDGASGQDLDRIGQILGIPRKNASQSIVVVRFANASAALVTIDAGRIFQIQNTEYQFTTPAALFTVPALGYVDALCTAIPTGPTPVSATQLWEWVSSFAGSTAVTMTNPAAGVLGADVEDDTAYRIRLATERGLNGAATLNAIFAAIDGLPLVQQSVVFENDSDAYGITSPKVVADLPPHSVVAAALGTATAADICATLFAKKAAGIATFGDTPVTVYDSQGLPHAVAYQKATDLPIYVTAHVTAPGLGVNDAGAIKAIKDAIAAYGATLRLADTVVYVKILSAVSDAVATATGLTLAIATHATPTETVNIVPDWDKAPTFDPAHMTITVN